MFSILLATALLGQVPSSPDYSTMMRMQQTQPHYLTPATPLPPGCGPYWDAQRAYQSMPKPFENYRPYYQPYYYQPYYYRPYRW